MAKMRYWLFGISHKTAPVSLREALVFSDEDSVALVRQLQSLSIDETFLISTCNRLEILSVLPDDVSPPKEILLQSLAKRLTDHSIPSKTSLPSHFYEYWDRDAVRHLFRVTSSLDSMIVGEPQITGQVKEAFQKATGWGSVGTYADRLVSKSLSVAKRVRNETRITEHPVSISYAAILLAEKIFGKLDHVRVLLIGAGEMGALAARHLKERNVQELTIVNRTDEKADELAQELQAKTIPWEKMGESLSQYDILISSTGAGKILVTEPMIRQALEKRKNKPMFLIDIALPRNMDPEIDALADIYLFDLDDLQGIVDENKLKREEEAKEAEKIITEETENFFVWMRHQNLAPTIEQFSRKMEIIRTVELEKLFSKNLDWTEAQKESVQVYTKAMINKILHDPIMAVKTEEGKEGSGRYTEVLKKLFRLEGDL